MWWWLGTKSGRFTRHVVPEQCYPCCHISKFPFWIKAQINKVMCP
jgi:hypothetical protein